jgi:hypothetical protein
MSAPQDRERRHPSPRFPLRKELTANDELVAEAIGR